MMKGDGMPPPPPPPENGAAGGAAPPARAGGNNYPAREAAFGIFASTDISDPEKEEVAARLEQEEAAKLKEERRRLRAEANRVAKAIGRMDISEQAEVLTPVPKFLHPRRQNFKIPKPTRNRGITLCLERMLDEPCKFHARPGKTPAHTTRQCSFTARLQQGPEAPPPPPEKGDDDMEEQPDTAGGSEFP
jgi:hypothetical protein